MAIQTRWDHLLVCRILYCQPYSSPGGRRSTYVPKNRHLIMRQYLFLDTVMLKHLVHLLREAHFTSSALGDQLGLLCVVCLSRFFEKIYTEQRQGDHAFTAWCFDRNIQILRVFPVFGPVSSATYASYLRIEGPENGHFSLFLNQFHQRLRLHICGLRGPEKGSVLTSGASRPCSAECCLVIVMFSY